MQLSCALFILLAFSSESFCQTIDSLKVGNGGGFSGQISVHKIVHRHVEKGVGIEMIQYTQQACLKKKSMRSLERSSLELLSKNFEFGHPSNTYKFIEIYSKGNKRRYVWGDPDFPAPKELLDLYQLMIQSLTSLKFEKK